MYSGYSGYIALENVFEFKFEFEPIQEQEKIVKVEKHVASCCNRRFAAKGDITKVNTVWCRDKNKIVYENIAQCFKAQF